MSSFFLHPRVQLKEAIEDLLAADTRERAEKLKVAGQNNEKDCGIKPPIGVMPWSIHINNRIEDLARTISERVTYLNECVKSPEEERRSYRLIAMCALEMDQLLRAVLGILKGIEEVRR